MAEPRGWIPAGWTPGAQVYFAGNLLQDGDLAWSVPGAVAAPWSTEGSMNADVGIADGNHHAILQTSGSERGWFSQTADAAEFYESLGAGALSAGPLRIRFGARARLASAGNRALQIAIVQWSDDLSVNYGTHIENVDVTDAYEHYVGEVSLIPGARRVQIRFSLPGDGGPALWMDDAFALISDVE